MQLIMFPNLQMPVWCEVGNRFHFSQTLDFTSASTKRNVLQTCGSLADKLSFNSQNQKVKMWLEAMGFLLQLQYVFSWLKKIQSLRLFTYEFSLKRKQFLLTYMTLLLIMHYICSFSFFFFIVSGLFASQLIFITLININKNLSVPG